MFRRDVSKTAGLVGDFFKVLDQYDTQERLKSDQFVYSSTHMVVQVPESWLRVPTLEALSGWKSEIQIRTLAQHTWAAASQTLQYKEEDSVPQTIRRSIHRVSALLETVDLELERVLDERANYRFDIHIRETDEELNVDLLERTLDSLLPEQNKRAGENYANLLEELRRLDVLTAQRVRQIWEKHKDTVVTREKETIQRRIDKLSESGTLVGATPERLERLKSGVYFSHVGLTRVALEEEFGREKFQVARVPVRRDDPRQ